MQASLISMIAVCACKVKSSSTCSSVMAPAIVYDVKVGMTFPFIRSKNYKFYIIAHVVDQCDFYFPKWAIRPNMDLASPHSLLCKNLSIQALGHAWGHIISYQAWSNICFISSMLGRFSMRCINIWFFKCTVVHLWNPSRSLMYSCRNVRIA